MGGLDVETRPAIVWATSLPKEWVRGKERMVLLILAADHSAGTPAPGRQALAEWAGLTLNQVDEALQRLSSEIPGVRPPLIERLDDAGQARRAGSGRHNTRYRLRTEIAPSPKPKPATSVLQQARRSTSPAPVDRVVERRTIPPENRGGLMSQPPQQPPQNPGASSSPTTRELSSEPPERARGPRLAELDAAGLSLAQAMCVGIVVGIRPDWTPKAIAHAIKTLPPTIRSRYTVEDLIGACRHWASNRHQKYPTQLGWQGHWPVVGEEEAQPPEPSPQDHSRGGVRSA